MVVIGAWTIWITTSGMTFNRAEVIDGFHPSLTSFKARKVCRQPAMNTLPVECWCLVCIWQTSAQLIFLCGLALDE